MTARFLASIDDGGEWLVVVGERCSVRRGGGLTVEVDAGGGELALRPSFHGGAAWTYTAPGASVARALADGERVELGARAGFVFRRPDEGSASAVLELQNGLEAAHAPRVLLWVPGAGGRVRIGLDRRAHVRLPAECGEAVHEWCVWPGVGLELGALRAALPLTGPVEVPLAAGRRALLAPCAASAG